MIFLRGQASAGQAMEVALTLLINRDNVRVTVICIDSPFSPHPQLITKNGHVLFGSLSWNPRVILDPLILFLLTPSPLPSAFTTVPIRPSSGSPSTVGRASVLSPGPLNRTPNQPPTSTHSFLLPVLFQPQHTVM